LNAGELRALSAIAIGPTIFLLALGLASSVIVSLSQTRALDTLKTFLQDSYDELFKSPVYCLISGFVSVVFAFFVVFAVLFQHPELRLLGVLILAITAVALTGGAILASAIVGKRILQLTELQLSPVLGFLLGIAALFTASLLPFAGWLAVALATFSGTGAILKCAFIRNKK
jgi:hypothetical protein